MSRPRVTITLGSSGQVVKRSGTTADGVHSDYVPLSGSKRPIKERLGSNVDNPMWYGQSKHKRQRGDGQSPSNDDVDDDKHFVSSSYARVGRDDLRLKLMRKNTYNHTRSNGQSRNDVDLREKLSQTVQPSVRTGTLQRLPEPKATALPRQIPPTRSADDLLQMDALRKSYSAWTLDGLRRRSPDRYIGASRGFSPPRSMGDMRSIPSLRSLGPSRSNRLMTKSILDAPRSAALVAKATEPLETAKPVPRLHPPSNFLQKNSYAVDEPHTVADFLQSLGLGKYSIPFQAEEIDMAALKQMGDHDLKELGIPMGPRKKIILALMPRSKHRQA